MDHPRLKILFALVAVFAFSVVVWYFLFSEPESAPTLEGTVNPLSIQDLPARFAFIFQGDEPTQTSETEITPGNTIPFIRVWDKPATGNILTTKQILKEEVATSTVGTTTVTTTKMVRATSTTLLFVDRLTGYVYGYDMEQGRTYQISNTTVPGVYDAYIFNNGERIVMRYLDNDKKTIISILATIPNIQEGRDPQPLIDVSYLPKDIKTITISRDTTLISYGISTESGMSFYTLSSKGIGKVVDSSFSEWILAYGGNQLYATTKATAYSEGSTFLLPSFSPRVSNKTGLTSTPTGNDIILSSMWSQNGLMTFGTSRGVATISSVKTLAQKCGPLSTSYYVCGVPKSLPQQTNGLPDDWYQGRVLFDDTLMLINAANGESFTLYSFEEKYGAIDVTHVHATTDAISFIRKQDSTLFLLNTALLKDNG